MKLPKRIYYTLAGAMPAGFLQKRLEPVTLFPYHHIVSDAPVPHVQHLYSYKNTREFTNDLDVLLKRFKTVTPEELQSSMNGGAALQKNSFLLSFDDGFREVHDVIAPILYQKGVPAIFFINPAFVDNNEMFYRSKISLIIAQVESMRSTDPLLRQCLMLFNPQTDQATPLVTELRSVNQHNAGLLDQVAEKLGIDFNSYLRHERPFMTTSEIRTLAGQGFSIGAHSWDHPYYQLLTLEDQLKQTKSSCGYIQATFGARLSLFSFPHADRGISQDFFDRMAVSEFPVDLYFGTQNQRVELQNKVLHRFNAERPILSMDKQVNGVLLLMLLDKMRGRQKLARNSITGR